LFYPLNYGEIGVDHYFDMRSKAGSAIPNSIASFVSLLRFYVGVADDLAPLLRFGLDERAEIVG
jgi:hypothetical protein